MNDMGNMSPQKTGGELRYHEGSVVPALLVAPVVLLLLQSS